MVNVVKTSEINTSESPTHPSQVQSEEKEDEEKDSVGNLKPIIDDFITSEGKSIPEDLCSPNTEASLEHSGDFRSNLPQPGDLNVNLLQQCDAKTKSSDVADSLLNPQLYLGYEHTIDTTETFADIIVKQLDNVKDFARDRTVFSLSVGEKSIIWTYKKLKYLSRKWFTHFILLFIILAYSMLGAVVFMALEAPQEELNQKQLDEVRNDMATKLKEMMMNETIFKANSSSFLELMKNELIAYENSYSDCLSHLNDKNTTNKSWTFWNAMVFSGTIYTTIGYGHITPKTTAGRVATIIYAIIGVPLLLILLTDFGKLLTRIIKYFWVYIINYIRRKKRNTSAVKRVKNGVNKKANDEVNTSSSPSPELKVDDNFNLPISFAVFILILYMICGAAGVYYLEPWTFFESFYFIFISMSTIGLGDFVSHYPLYIYVAILYIIFGLSLTSMCINVVQQKISDSIKKSKLIEIIETSSVCEDGDSIIIATKDKIAPVHKPRDELVESINDKNKSKLKESYDR